MKKALLFVKFVGGLLLAAYSVLMVFYLFISATVMIAVMFGSITYSGSSLEESIRWFANHPITLIISIIMMILGLLIMGWDDIAKRYQGWKERKNSLYLRDCR